MNRVFWCEIALFLPRSRFPAKALRYADDTLLFQDSAIGGYAMIQDFL